MLITRKTSIHALHNRGDINNKSTEKEATCYLYGDIGGWFGVDHQQFIKDFNAITADTIHLRVDSQGGDIFAARAIKTCIQQHKAKVIAHIDGLAASAASFLIMGADEIEIVDGGFLMIHNAMSFMDILGYFNIDDLNQLLIDIGKEVELHGKINESIANDYMAKSKKKKDEIMGWMDNETWFTSQEALDAGLVDRIYDGTPVEGAYDLSVFAKVPESLKLRNQKDAKRTIERALRDAGLKDKEAKTILAKGYKEFQDEVQRDTVPPPVVPPVTDPPPVENRDENPPVVVIPAKKDRIADLLCRAEIVAPS